MIKEALLYENKDGLCVHCCLCNHHCKISDSEFGFCRVRENRKGKLYTHAYGEVVAANSDPIEKKPLYHFLPGSRTFSIAAAGCNFHCGFCQNWQISQAPNRKGIDLNNVKLLPGDVVDHALARNCKSISYTYTEPTIFFEYALETAQRVKKENLRNIMVTNGYMTVDAIRMIRPYLDACNVDLKSFSDKFYVDNCHGHLKPVLNSIEEMKSLGIWIEITTLIIPDQNDSEDELRAIADFIAELDTDIPWHISRFHPDYQFTNSKPTPLDTLEIAGDIGRNAGLKYIYKGNVLGEATETLCSICGETLVRRYGFLIDMNRIQGSSCPSCGSQVAGVF